MVLNAAGSKGAWPGQRQVSSGEAALPAAWLQPQLSYCPQGRPEAGRSWQRHHVPKPRALPPQPAMEGVVLAGALQREVG